MNLQRHSEIVLFLHLSLISLSFHFSFANEKITALNPLHNNCNKIFSDDKGSLAYNGKQSNVPENITCSWFFKYQPNDEFNDIYMEIKNFALFENDSFVIKNQNSGKVIYGPLTGFLSPFVIATGTRNIEVQLITSPKKYNSERSFLINYSTKDCSLDLNGLQSGIISSPVYFPKRNQPLQCLYKFQGYRASKSSLESLALTFMNMTLRNSVINITSTAEKDVVSSSTPDFPKIYFGKGALSISMNLDTESFDSFRILYEVVPDACSGRIDLNATNSSTSILFLTPDNGDMVPLTRDTITCNWLIRSPLGTRIRAGFPSLQLLSLEDRLVISSPEYEQFAPLHLSALNNHLFKDKLLLSPTNEFLVKFSTMQILPGLHFAADFSIFKDNGLNENRGTITVKDVGDYNFRVEKDKVVNIEFAEQIDSDAVIELYSHFENTDSHFLTLDEKYNLKWVASPTNELKMVVKRIKNGKNVKMQFYPMDNGCNQTLLEDRGNLHLSVVDCHRRCLYIFPSKISTDVYNFRIENSGASIKMSSLYKNPINLLDLSYPESSINSKVNVPVEDGVLFEISRKCRSNGHNNPNVKIAYLTQKSCDRKFWMSVGENIALSSPDYPDNYPMNANCRWLFEPNENKPVFSYVSFNQFMIEKGDKITLKTDETEISLGNGQAISDSSLPDDMIFKSPFNVNFESQNKILPVSGKSHKFSFQSMAFDCGGIETSSKGALTITQENAPNLCIWLISVPLKSDFDYTNVFVSMPNKGPGITIYDGPSVRSPILKFIGDIAISSSNKIIVLYKPGEPLSNTKFKIEYDSIGCNKTFACQTGSCMKPGWKCNGVNECGDYSDERGCSIPTPSIPKTTTKLDTDSSDSLILISTISGDYDVTTEQVDIATNADRDSGHQQQVIHADSKVSIATLALAASGCIFFTIIVVAIIAYFVHKQYVKNMYRNRWDSLSTSNPSYQSEKDCVSI